ncbi:MAG: antitoxin family protein [Nitrospirota bacterium]
MSKVIDAVFEDGVFKPLEKVKVKEREKVTDENIVERENS